jgi:hypothetical protein
MALLQHLTSWQSQCKSMDLLFSSTLTIHHKEEFSTQELKNLNFVKKLKIKTIKWVCFRHEAIPHRNNDEYTSA